jgi:hypothetical protein
MFEVSNTWAIIWEEMCFEHRKKGEMSTKLIICVLSTEKRVKWAPNWLYVKRAPKKGGNEHQINYMFFEHRKKSEMSTNWTEQYKIYQLSFEPIKIVVNRYFAIKLWLALLILINPMTIHK